MKPKGIMFKTFMFTTALIALVGLISFGILYAVLPGYYGYMKNRSLSRNADTLISSLAQADADEVKSQLARFCTDNNATVNAFDADGQLLPELSYPLIMLEDGAKMGYSIAITMAEGGGALIRNETRRFIAGVTSDTGTPEDKLNVAFFHTSASGGQQSVGMTRTVASDIVGTVDIFSTLQPIDEAQGVVLSLIPYLLSLDILIALIAAYFYSRRLTRPIIRLSDTAERMQQLTPGIASGITADDELGQLSRNLDSLYLRFCGALRTVEEEMTKVSEMEQSKTDFMRAASHELKTPLAALNGITEGMLDGVGVYANKPRYLNESKRLIERMTLLVEEILNASKLEYQSETISPGDVELSGLVSSVLADYDYEIAEKELAVDCACEQFIYRTDERIMRSALSNIISNAVRYTGHGGKVSISLTRRELYVENECQGIPEEDLQRVFEPFYVPDYSRDRSRHGTGIGLFIVKRNLDMLGIEHELVNTETGVRFVLRL